MAPASGGGATGPWHGSEVGGGGVAAPDMPAPGPGHGGPLAPGPACCGGPCKAAGGQKAGNG
eukprot:2279572-Lingulodinium_polyedra.AAC.1